MSHYSEISKELGNSFVEMMKLKVKSKLDLGIFLV